MPTSSVKISGSVWYFDLVGARLFGEEDFGPVWCFGLNLNLSNTQQSWPAEVLFIKETGQLQRTNRNRVLLVEVHT
ncbi:hypothetical protein CBP31_14365 [Oceanisphaera profunda]|uniref:Uncharacterized protein n=1 Tax=Oceanisphaera profunda TaxID=1416627 RepID=A0A1Y0D7Y4_9GAMM|nr:hypothetical protein CBP31_14365 [Oceanisphaera profunda]